PEAQRQGDAEDGKTGDQPCAQLVEVVDDAHLILECCWSDAAHGWSPWGGGGRLVVARSRGGVFDPVGRHGTAVGCGRRHGLDRASLGYLRRRLVRFTRD